MQSRVFCTIKGTFTWQHVFFVPVFAGFCWVFPKILGKPPKWMVKIMVPNPIKIDNLMENFIKIDDLVVKSHIFGSTPLFKRTKKFTSVFPNRMFTRGAIHHSLGLDQFGGEGWVHHKHQPLHNQP